MKRILIIFGSVLLLLLGAGIAYLVWEGHVTRQWIARYEQTQRGMSVEQIQKIMGETGIWGSLENVYPSWDDDRLSPEEAQRITSALSYSVPRTIMPMTLEFTFDDQRRLVGRHSYD